MVPIGGSLEYSEGESNLDSSGAIIGAENIFQAVRESQTQSASEVEVKADKTEVSLPFIGALEFTAYHLTEETIEEIEKDSTAVFPLGEFNLKPKLDTAKEAAVETIKKVGEETKTIFSALWELLTNYLVSSDFKDKVKGFLGKFKKPKKEDPEAEKKKAEAAQAKSFQQNIEAQKSEKKQLSQAELFKQATGRGVTMQEVIELSGSADRKRELYEDIYNIAVAATKKSEKIKAQQRATREQSMAEVTSKGPDLSLNKVAEGGSVLSTTGGVGAG